MLELQYFLIGFIQGITEFLPVSSSSHLILISKYFNFSNQGLSIDVSLHIGSFIAVLVYFHKDIVSLLDNKILFLKILIIEYIERKDNKKKSILLLNKTLDNLKNIPPPEKVDL